VLPISPIIEQGFDNCQGLASLEFSKSGQYGLAAARQNAGNAYQRRLRALLIKKGMARAPSRATVRTRRRAIKGTYVGYVTDHDPLYDFLSSISRDLAGARQPRPAFRAFRLRGSNEVYAYEEKSSGTKIICKFYGPKFPADPGLAAAVAQREHDNLNTLRGYHLTGSPHHVIRPLGIHPDINGALAVEYFHGEELIYAIERATYGQGGARLFARLQALAYFLATQHNRTVTRETVDFGPVCEYFDRVIDGLHRRGRIGQWDVDEFSWLRDIWRGRPRMWEDWQVWLHGDVTPANFLFGTGIDVAAIDLERSKRGDRVFDVGRLAGELQHAFMMTTGHKHRAEPFIRYFLKEYCSHLPDRDLAFEAVTGRVPYHMGLTLLRIARNDHITNEYNGMLIRQAKKLLRAP
jgi:aminoglycoside phosphotransferase (APT) family kinase protein